MVGARVVLRLHRLRLRRHRRPALHRVGRPPTRSRSTAGRSWPASRSWARTTPSCAPRGCAAATAELRQDGARPGPRPASQLTRGRRPARLPDLRRRPGRHDPPPRRGRPPRHVPRHQPGPDHLVPVRRATSWRPPASTRGLVTPDHHRRAATRPGPRPARPTRARQRRPPPVGHAAAPRPPRRRCERLVKELRPRPVSGPMSDDRRHRRRLRRAHHRPPASPTSATRSCAPTSCPSRVERLSRGEVPILEAGLPELVREGLDGGRLTFVLGRGRGRRRLRVRLPLRAHAPGRRRLGRPVLHPGRGGRRSARCCRRRRSSSTSRPCRWARPGWSRRCSGRDDVRVVSNPEFLREGSAVHDFLHPDRIVIGCRRPGRPPSGWPPCSSPCAAPVIVTDPASAETIKYASNAFLATKVSFVNAVANVCEAVGADVRDVAPGHGLRQAHRLRVPQARPRLGRLAASRRTPAP